MRRCVTYTHQVSVEGDDVGNEASGDGGKGTSQRGTQSHFGAQAGHRHTPISKDFFLSQEEISWEEELSGHRTTGRLLPVTRNKGK